MSIGIRPTEGFSGNGGTGETLTQYLTTSGKPRVARERRSRCPFEIDVRLQSAPACGRYFVVASSNFGPELLQIANHILGAFELNRVDMDVTTNAFPNHTLLN